jgi:hypothetical protein
MYFLGKFFEKIGVGMGKIKLCRYRSLVKARSHDARTMHEFKHKCPYKDMSGP